MDNPAFVAELKSWIRFNDAQALRTGDGLFSPASGNPAVPPWLGSALFPLLFKASSENDKYAKQVRSSAGIAVFASEGPLMPRSLRRPLDAVLVAATANLI